MHVGVDETGRDHLPRRVDADLRLRRLELANGGDPVTANADIAVKPGQTAAVHDSAAGDQNVEHESSVVKYSWSGASSKNTVRNEEQPVCATADDDL